MGVIHNELGGRPETQSGTDPKQPSIGRVAALAEPVTKPYISADTSLPEITFRALILGILLTLLLAASSTFVGLKIAKTMAGSIPAALISMMVLRFFKNASILENNIVQTIASAGEAVAAGVIFSLPALIIVGYWQSFNYFQTVIIILMGGLLGVLFSVPLRRNLVVTDQMPYPEGVAIAEILIAGEKFKKNRRSIHVLLQAGFCGAFITFFQTGFKIAGVQLQYWTKVGTTAFGGSLLLSPMLMAVGYIAGMRALMTFVAGGIFTWGIAIPFYVFFRGINPPESSVSIMELLTGIQKSHFRYIAIGVLAMGGVWSLLSLLKQAAGAIVTAVYTLKKGRKESHHPAFRTELDISLRFVLSGILVIALLTFMLFFSLIDKANMSLGTSLFWGTVVFATLFSLLIGFICAVIAVSIVGIVGTTSLPVSGITVFAIIGFSSLLLTLLKGNIDFQVNIGAALEASALVIIFATVVCVGSMVSSHTMQSLKVGDRVGGTPWKQQVVSIVGVIVSALFIPFILQTAFEAHGFGDILPRSLMDPKKSLPAPQANLMAAVTQGIFEGKLPWEMIEVGLVLGLLIILIDEILKRKNNGYRFPVFLFALGMYFPLGYVTAFLVGGIIRALVKRKLKMNKSSDAGILFASGIIAGEALLGALLTIPFAYYQSTEIFKLKLTWFLPYENVFGPLIYIGLCVFLYKQATIKQAAC